MEAKKSKRADLETKKSIFFQAGLIVTLTLTILAFEWRSPVKHNLVLDPGRKTVIEDDIIALSTHEIPRPAVVPPSFTLFNEVKDDQIQTDYDPLDAESDEGEEIPEYIPTKITDLKDEPRIEDPSEFFLVVEKQPEFPGGIDEMRKFLGDNIQYPEIAKAANIQGTVHLFFIVEKDGSISNNEVARSIGGGCDEEAIRVIKRMPRWNPGLQQMKPVRVKFSIPIGFRLSN